MGKHSKYEPSRVNRKAVAAGAVVAGGLSSVALSGSAGAASVSDWDKIAQCESGGDWAINHSSDGMSVGGLQFQNASWKDALSYLKSHGYDVSTWTQTLYQGMPRSAVPTKDQTILAGEALLAIQGPGAWVCNSMVGSPLQSSGPHGSMFKGGIDPTGGTAPAPSDGGSGSTTPDPGTSAGAGSSGDDSAPTSGRGHGSRWGHRGHWGGQARGDQNSGSYYVVQRGDFLSKIAGDKLGDPGRWSDIYQMNRQVIGADPDLIHPGQHLKMPDGSVTDPGQTDTPAAPADDTAAPAPSADWMSPANCRVGQAFGNPSSGYTLGYHTGVDLSCPSGTTVVSPGAGTVVASDTSSAYGINVQVKFADGRYGLFAHLSSKSVAPGDTVTAGQTLGKSGSTGNSTGPHLHFEIRLSPEFKAGNFLDPVSWLKGHGVTI